MTILRAIIDTIALPVAYLFTVTALTGSAYFLFLAFVGLRTKATGGPERSKQTRFLVLIPAHNEGTGIVPTLESLRNVDYPHDNVRVVVIADNCSDDTAAVVERFGYESWVRVAPNARGKGRALQWALDRASEFEYDAVAFLDADTTVEPNFLSALNVAICKGAKAMQVRYDFDTTDSQAPDHSKLSALGKDSETALFWRPRQRLGLAIILQGNGIAFTRDTLQRVPWSAYSIVEDLEFSLDLAIKGTHVQYVESTKVLARSTKSVSAALPQRIRWASGTFQVAAKYVPRLLLAAVRQRSFYLAEAAAAVTFLSRVLLIYVLAMSAVLCVIVPNGPAALAVRIMVVCSVLLQVCYLGVLVRALPEYFDGRWSNLIFLPVYVMWIVFVQCMALVGFRKNVWARTVR